MKIWSKTVQKQVPKPSEYMILHDPFLFAMAQSAYSDKRVGGVFTELKTDLEDFVHRVEKRLETEIAKEDYAVIREQVNQLVNETINDITMHYRAVAEEVAKREICADFGSNIADAADELVEKRMDYMKSEVDKSLLQMNMGYTSVLLNLSEGIKGYEGFDQKRFRKYSKKTGRIYLSFWRESMSRMHSLCDQLQKNGGVNLKLAQQVDKTQVKVQREKIKLEDYSQLEVYLDYYQTKLNGAFTADIKELIDDKSVLKRLDKLVDETKMFSVVIGYTILKGIYNEVDPTLLHRTGVDMEQFRKVLDSYGFK
jgi:hypothetical protein